MCINENDNGVLFLALVDKGFNKPVAFNCLERIKGDFDRFFTDEQIKNAKPYELNSEFQGYVERAWVSVFLMDGV
jgi:Regulated-SNARE-like domain